MTKTVVGSFDTFEHAREVVGALESLGVASGDVSLVASGAGKGAVAVSLIGGLRQAGVSDGDAEHYAEAVRRGGALLIVRADDDRAPRIADAMHERGAIDIESRVAAWRESGWAGHDPSAPPYSVEEIARERAGLRGAAAGTMRDPHEAQRDLRSGTATGTRSARRGTGDTAHPNLGVGSDRPGVDVRGTERVSADRAEMRGGSGGSGEGVVGGGTVRGTPGRAGDAIERTLPGDANGDGR